MSFLVSPHTHPESPLTGSTLAHMIDRAKELGREYFAYTDLGHLSSALKAYGLTKKAGLKFIPGMEIYFKDPTCTLLTQGNIAKAKYFTTTVYCEDQEAYQALCRIASKTDSDYVTVQGEAHQLWTWADLDAISKFNTNIVLGGIHCLVSKPMLAEQATIGNQVLSKLIKIFGNRIRVSMLCEPWTKMWCSLVEIRYQDGSKDILKSTDWVTTDKARRIKASNLLFGNLHTRIKNKSDNLIYYPIDKAIKEVVEHKGFIPLPGGDVTLRVNKFLRALANKYNLPILATDYAYYSNKEDKIVQAMRLEGDTKLQPNFHMKNQDEIVSYLTKQMNLTVLQAEAVLENNTKWASLFDNLTLTYEWRLADSGGDPLKQAMVIIRENGRMRWDDSTYVERLRYELNVIAKNGKKDLTAYFLPIRDVLNHYKENGQLTGPSRGSAGGSLFCYLLGITQLDPIKWDLPFNRFFSMERIMMGKLPDVDVDLEHRELLVGKDNKSGYLYNTWSDKAAQISTRTTIRLKSAIKDVHRYLNNGKVEPYIETLTKGLPPPPQGISDRDFVFGFEDKDEGHVPGLIEGSDDLKDYVKKHPKDWNIVTKAMGLTRAFSTHASAFLLSDIPIKDTIPTKEGHITQYEAKESEAAGLIKYDFLVVSQLKDIRICLDLINKRSDSSLEVGQFIHKDKQLYIWDLPELPEVFRSIWGGATETLFQINSRSMTPFVMEILPDSIYDLGLILALVRPGPLDFVDADTGRNMAEEYVELRKGNTTPKIKELADILPETHSVIVFQEQLSTIAKVLAGFTNEAAELLRENMAKKKMTELMKIKPAFLEGASKNTSLETAELIWEQMVTFGRYGFSCFTEDQLIQTKLGVRTIKEAYETKMEIAYLDDNKVKYESPSHWFDQGIKEVFEIELEDGSLIKCTSDHLFMDENGLWKTAKEMVELGFFYGQE